MPRILIVDDEPQVRDLLRTVMEDEGYAVQTAADGRIALELMRGVLPDLIISDVMMPRLDGFGVLAQVREQSATLPVILISAAGPLVARRARAHADQTVFLPKPFDIEELLAIVRRLTAA